MKEEIWKPVVGFEGLYEVSSLGRVKSLGNDKTRKEKVLKPCKTKKGYLYVTLCKDGKKNMLIHRLVSVAFLDNSNNLPCINHKDEDKTNNCTWNLEWCTYKYNNQYSKVWDKSSEVISKPVIQFTKDGQFVKEYKSGYEAERQTGINQRQISMCCLGRKGYKSAGNYKWKFKYE